MPFDNCYCYTFPLSDAVRMAHRITCDTVHSDNYTDFLGLNIHYYTHAFLWKCKVGQKLSDLFIWKMALHRSYVVWPSDIDVSASCVKLHPGEGNLWITRPNVLYCQNPWHKGCDMNEYGCIISLLGASIHHIVFMFLLLLLPNRMKEL